MNIKINSSALGDNIACMIGLKQRGDVRVITEYAYQDLFNLFGFKTGIKEEGVEIYPSDLKKNDKVFYFINNFHLGELCCLKLGVRNDGILPILKGSGRGDYILINGAFADDIRSIPGRVLKYICDKAKCEGIKVKVIGDSKTRGRGDMRVFFDNLECENLVNKTSIIESLDIINKARVYITVDSGGLWLGQLTNVNMVSIFYNINPLYRLTIREGRTEVIVPNLSCRYCSGNCGPGKYFGCFDYLYSRGLNRDELMCHKILSEVEVWERVMKLFNS